MEELVIQHAARTFHFTAIRRVEFEAEVMPGPEDLGYPEARCSNCGCVMMYRGIARLRDGRLVHYFECVHSPREVHSLSRVIGD